MAIRKSNDIANDANVNARIKNTVKIEEILERYNVEKTDNILPGDEALGYLNQKVDECIDTINDNATAVSSSGTVEKAKALNTARTIGGVSFDGTSNIDLPGVNSAGNQNTSGRAATATLAAESTALETARTIGGVSFDGTANIDLPGVNVRGDQDTTGTAANATNSQYLYLPKTANFNADISSGAVYIPLSDGETEGSSTTRRTVFIAPCTGSVHKVHIRSNGSLLSSGRAANLQVKAWAAPDGSSTLRELESEDVETVAGNTAMVATFSSANFTVGQQVHITMQLTDRVPTGAKNYYVTAVFKLDQNTM